MTLIDNTYFNNDINLTSEQLNIVQQWITDYEPVLLKKLLGYDLYTLLETDLNGTADPTAQRFKDLVDGKAFSFTYYGTDISTKWGGLRDKTLLKSVIAHYVYYQYRNEDESFNSNAGQVSPLGENSSKVSVQPKLRTTWNKVVDIYGATPKQINCMEYFLNAENYEHYNAYPSAYNFLLANADTYPEWVFEPIEKVNKYNL